jgi:hypothetical protein
LAIRLFPVPIGVGVGIGIGIDSAGVLWCPHARFSLSLPIVVGIATIRSSKALRVAFPSGESDPHPVLVSKFDLLSFDTDSDTDPDPDYNPCRDRDA